MALVHGSASWPDGPARPTVLLEDQPPETTKMAARTKSKVTPKYKTKYRVRNWAAYEKSLRRRGDITIWFAAAAVRSWNARPTG